MTGRWRVRRSTTLGKGARRASLPRAGGPRRGAASAQAAVCLVHPRSGVARSPGIGTTPSAATMSGRHTGCNHWLTWLSWQRSMSLTDYERCRGGAVRSQLRRWTRNDGRVLCGPSHVLHRPASSANERQVPEHTHTEALCALLLSRQRTRKPLLTIELTYYAWCE
jgi:hypothetical protein